jgi:hypothetical protein
LLVHAFKRRHIFEIGTYIGTSAVAMAQAAALHGGVVITCDPEDYGCLPTTLGIRFIRGTDHTAAQTLRAEGIRPDFVFADSMISEATLSILNDIGSEDMIIAVHDYLPGDKGERNKELIDARYKRAADGVWMLPFKGTVTLAAGVCVQEATAVLMPRSLLTEIMPTENLRLSVGGADRSR